MELRHLATYVYAAAFSKNKLEFCIIFYFLVRTINTQNQANTVKIDIGN